MLAKYLQESWGAERILAKIVQKSWRAEIIPAIYVCRSWGAREYQLNKYGTEILGS